MSIAHSAGSDCPDATTRPASQFGRNGHSGHSPAGETPGVEKRNHHTGTGTPEEGAVGITDAIGRTRSFKYISELGQPDPPDDTPWPAANGTTRHGIAGEQEGGEL